MTEEKIDSDIKVEVETNNNEVTVETVETVEPQVKEVKTTSARKKKKVEEVKQIEVELNADTTNNTELEDLRKELEVMKAEKLKLEEERKVLNETVTKLQEEVKITPQKLGEVIKQMGVAPISTTRDKEGGMNIETYNAMSDSARREWQRTHRAEYLNMLHNIKLN